MIIQGFLFECHTGAGATSVPVRHWCSAPPALHWHCRDQSSNFSFRPETFRPFFLLPDYLGTGSRTTPTDPPTEPPTDYPQNRI